MPTPTYDLLASTVLSSATGSVTFSSLNTVASGYRHLVIHADAKASASSYYAFMRFNNNTITQRYIYMNGNGASKTQSLTGDDKFQLGANGSYWRSSENSSVIIEIPDFALASKHKAALVRFNNPYQAVEFMACRLPDTTPITSVTLTMNVSTFAAGGRFYLYGIKL